MSKCAKFLEFFDAMATELNADVPAEVQEFYDILQASVKNFAEKPAFTETGLQILEYLQKCGIKSMKAKEIADGMLQPSKKISGAMRKLCSDGYVEKFGQNPVIYALTEKGKTIDLTTIIKENNENA